MGRRRLERRRESEVDGGGTGVPESGRHQRQSRDRTIQADSEHLSEGTYSKPEHGPLIAEAIGIDAMRQKCAQFDAWVAHLQAWGN
jgi:hypothetical protein